MFTLDDEYVLTMKRAELQWLSGTIADLRSGELDWSEEWIRDVAQKMAEAEN